MSPPLLFLVVNSLRLISIRRDLLEKYKKDSEVLQKSKRPYVLVIRLSYKGQNHNFAIPIRSNIPAASPKNEYFPLPPRSTTKPKNRHGVHYIKMFPVTSEYYLRYRTEDNQFATLVKNIIDKNAKQIIAECQKYLFDYEKGVHPKYSTDIDMLLKILNDK